MKNPNIYQELEEITYHILLNRLEIEKLKEAPTVDQSKVSQLIEEDLLLINRIKRMGFDFDKLGPLCDPLI